MLLNFESKIMKVVMLCENFTHKKICKTILPCVLELKHFFIYMEPKIQKICLSKGDVTVKASFQTYLLIDDFPELETTKTIYNPLIATLFPLYKLGPIFETFS